jgi:hypothetical protein
MSDTHANFVDRILEKLPLDPGGIIAFKVSPSMQRRATKLAERNNAGGLSFDESLELQKFMAVESVMRVLKAKALCQKSELARDPRRVKKHG